MVIVDTSIWISLYRKRSDAIGQTIWMLVARNEAAVTGQIQVEFLGGFRDRSTRAAYAASLSAYPFVETGRAAYDLAVELLAAHPRLGAGDAIIAGTAMISGAALWTTDRDSKCSDHSRGEYASSQQPPKQLIASNPQDQTVAAGSSVHLSVSPSATPPVTYQWYSGATGDTTVPVNGATSDSLDVTPTATTSY